MASRILSVGTSVPSRRLPQPEMRDFFIAQSGTDRLAERLIRSVYDHSAIENRYAVIDVS